MRGEEEGGGWEEDKREQRKLGSKEKQERD